MFVLLFDLLVEPALARDKKQVSSSLAYSQPSGKR